MSGSITFDSSAPNVRRRPFWMTENHFRWHFSPFQINTQLLLFWIFFTKWPPAAIAAILDDRKSLSTAFLAKFVFKMAIWDSDFCQNRQGSPSIVGQWLHQIWSAQAFSSYFHKMAAGGHFGSSDILQNR